MKIKIYGMKDTKAGKFASPFYAPNDELAKRMLHNTVNTETENNFLNKYPEDYQLFRLGEYEEETGEIKSEIEFLANASEFKKVEWHWKEKKQDQEKKETEEKTKWSSEQNL